MVDQSIKSEEFNILVLSVGTGEYKNMVRLSEPMNKLIIAGVR